MTSLKEATQHIIIDSAAVVGGVSSAEAAMALLNPTIREYMFHNDFQMVAAACGMIVALVGIDAVHRKNKTNRSTTRPFKHLQGIG